MLDRQYVFFPEPMQDADWAMLSGLPLQPVRFAAADGTALHGWWLPAGESAPALLWFHGNAGNISHRIENMAALHDRGLSLFIFDYRGYGLSAGEPSETGLYEDGEAAYAVLRERFRIPPERIVIFGRSLGASVAADTAARHPEAAGLILETPFPSIAAVARILYAGLPVHQLVRSRFDMLERLPRVRMPVLVIHGDSDSIIPYELGRQVFEAAPEPKTFHTIPGADHNDTYIVGGEEYFRVLLGFVEGVTL